MLNKKQTLSCVFVYGDGFNTIYNTIQNILFSGNLLRGMGELWTGGYGIVTFLAS